MYSVGIALYLHENAFLATSATVGHLVMHNMCCQFSGELGFQALACPFSCKDTSSTYSWGSRWWACRHIWVLCCAVLCCAVLCCAVSFRQVAYATAACCQDYLAVLSCTQLNDSSSSMHLSNMRKDNPQTHISALLYACDPCWVSEQVSKQASRLTNTHTHSFKAPPVELLETVGVMVAGVRIPGAQSSPSRTQVL